MNIPYSHRTKLSLWKEITTLRKRINAMEQKNYKFDNVCEAALWVVLKNFPAQTKEGIMSKRRYAELVYPRHILMWLLRNYTNKGIVQIGLFIGARDHSTVLHGSNSISDYIITDKSKRDEIMKIAEEFTLALDATKL